MYGVIKGLYGDCKGLWGNMWVVGDINPTVENQIENDMERGAISVWNNKAVRRELRNAEKGHATV